MKLEKAFLALLLIAGSAAAQLVPVDKEVRINGNTPLAAETAVAMEPDGSFLVVWDNLQGDGSFSCGPDGVIYGRWFYADGAPRAPRFVIATDQILCQTDLRLVRAGDGSHLLTWQTVQGKYGPAAVQGACSRCPAIRCGSRVCCWTTRLVGPSSRCPRDGSC